MGCGGSKPAKPRGTTISRPQELILQVPRPQVDYNGRPIRVEDYELDRQTLRAALTAMANYIDNQRQEITIITVGGAVNTMLLQTRDSTHDVDFFGTNLNNNQRVLLDEAAKYAERKSLTPLGAEWFNSQTMLWLPPDVHHTVTDEALRQNEIVFHKRGLKVIAAPWNYALCGKMNRLVRPDQTRPYDLADAVSYLRYYIEKHGRPVSSARIKEWCRHYQKETSNEVIRAINEEYKRRYRTDGISR
ncbi:MAG: hypothetical protein L6R42_005656 [Xanthoria sp. 1 TBL-2021]|nr:MAG: hypothetical protein L6R42_005656 [Xanthoria sp. 1 TBL-2021]